MFGKHYFLILFCCLSSVLMAQNMDYGRTVIDTLSSPSFNGRGAVTKGELKAAEYLKKEFKYLGLKAFDAGYFQSFQYPINTFPGKMKVSFDGTELVPGVDYLVHPTSSDIYGTFNLIWYTLQNVPTKKQLKQLVSIEFFKNKFILLDGINKDEEVYTMLQMNLIGAAGIIEVIEDKLTHGLSTSYNDYASLRIKKEALTKKFKSISLEIDQKLLNNYESQNVIGYVEGADYPDSIVVLSAHYDHLGMMGAQVYFPGANDNASGIAMLLNLAFHYTHKEPPTKTMVFIAFGAEEAGLIGSKFFTDNPIFPLEKINFVFNMDLMGTGGEGAMIVNGTVYKEQMNLLDSINNSRDYLPSIKTRGKAANSDHFWFSEKGIPAFFMYTLGGIKAYHDLDDVSATLPLSEFEDCFRLIRDFIDEL
jgi:hypothetical protein